MGEPKQVTVEPSNEGFSPSGAHLQVTPDNGFENPSGDRMGVSTEEFEAFGGGVEPPGGVPDRAGAEAPETAQNPAGDRLPKSAEEAKAPEDPKRPAEKAAPEEGAEEEPASTEGSDGQSPLMDPSLQSIIQKYGTAERLADGVRKLQTLTNLKGDELKKVQSELGEKLELIDRYFETDESGAITLRTDRAIERLSSANLPPTAVDEGEARKEVLKEQEALLRQAGLDDDDIPDALHNLEPTINEATKRRVAARQGSVTRFHREQQRKAQAIATKFFVDHPEYTEHIPAIDSWLKRIPEHVRAHAIIGNWLPLDRLAQLAQLESSVEQMVTEAWNAGKAAGANGSIEPTTGSAPSSTPAPAGSRPGMKDPHAEMKAGILNAGRLESVETLFGD